MVENLFIFAANYTQMIDANKLDSLCFAFYEALLSKSYSEAKEVYKIAVELSKDSNYRKTARRAIPKYERDNKKSLSIWQTSLFLSPDNERLDEYINAPTNL